MRTQLTPRNSRRANLGSIGCYCLKKLMVILPQKESEEFSLEKDHLLKPLMSWKLFPLPTDFALEHVLVNMWSAKALHTFFPSVCSHLYSNYTKDCNVLWAEFKCSLNTLRIIWNKLTFPAGVAFMRSFSMSPLFWGLSSTQAIQKRDKTCCPSWPCTAI